MKKIILIIIAVIGFSVNGFTQGPPPPPPGVNPDNTTTDGDVRVGDSLPIGSGIIILSVAAGSYAFYRREKNSK